MKEIVIHQETVEKEEVVLVICNRCGKVDDSEQVALASEIETWTHSFGYGSKQDGTTMEFELCDDCVLEIIKTFKYPPQTIHQI